MGVFNWLTGKRTSQSIQQPTAQFKQPTIEKFLRADTTPKDSLEGKMIIDIITCMTSDKDFAIEKVMPFSWGHYLSPELNPNDFRIVSFSLLGDFFTLPCHISSRGTLRLSQGLDNIWRSVASRYYRTSRPLASFDTSRKSSSSSDVETEWGQPLQKGDFNIVGVQGNQGRMSTGQRYNISFRSSAMSSDVITGRIEGWYMELTQFYPIIIIRLDNGVVTRLHTTSITNFVQLA